MTRIALVVILWIPAAFSIASEGVPPKIDGTQLRSLIAELKAKKYKSISECPKEEIGLLRSCFSRYFGSMPSFDNLLALDPEDFSDDVKAAASFVAQLCINSTDKSVLNVFGRPTAIKVLSPNILIVGYRIGQVNELDFEIGDGKVLRISEASVYSNIRIGNHEISRDVRNRQLLAYYAERVRKNDIVKYRELSNDMQISIRKVLGYVTQKTPIDADDKQNLVTVCSLFKGEASSRVLEVFGAPTAITGTKDEGKLHGYTLDYSAGIRFFFNIEGSLDRTEVR